MPRSLAKIHNTRASLASVLLHAHAPIASSVFKSWVQHLKERLRYYESVLSAHSPVQRHRRKQNRSITGVDHFGVLKRFVDDLRHAAWKASSGVYGLERAY